MENKTASKNAPSSNLQTPKIEKNKLETENEKVSAKIENTDSNYKGAVKDNNVAVKDEKSIKKDEVDFSKDVLEGEIFSAYETVSSVNSQDLMEDIDLSSAAEEDFNVVVQIKNELAFCKNKESSERTFYPKHRNNKCSKKINQCLHDYTNKRYECNRFFKQQKHWKNNIDNKNNKYDKKDGNSIEREEFHLTKRAGSHNLDWNIYHSKRHHKNRDDFDSLSKHSRSSERSNRSRRSRSLEKNIRSNSSKFKGRKTEERPTHKNTTNLKSNHTCKKRIKNPVSRSCIWKRLDNRLSSSRKDSENRQPTRDLINSSRKKERTPFLELERKLNEADSLKNIKKETASASTALPEVSYSAAGSTPPTEMQTVNQNPNQQYQWTSAPQGLNAPRLMFPFQCKPMPTVSLDNLPLVPGSTGLPVHITMSGEQIFHDIDGRRIPVGPNGYYLPLDPTGRLFPHIVSPGNQAVPIHMTADGVLRLPNSQPVPYGPGHKLPVNIDGTVIFIGPDSKPLYPCLNIPREPPLHLLNMINSLGTEQTSDWSVGIPTNQIVNQAMRPVELQQEQNRNEGGFQPPVTGANIPIPLEKNNKLLGKCETNSRKRRGETLKIVDVEEDPGVSSSTEATKRAKVSQSNDVDSINTDIFLASGDADFTLKPTLVPKIELTDEIVISSDDEEEDVVVTFCDKNNFKTPNNEAKSKDLIKRKTQQAIMKLNEGKYRPPALGRFIISKIPDVKVGKSSDLKNESPLLRNRVRLSFLTPSREDSANEEPANEEESTIAFLPQKKSEAGEQSPEKRLSVSKSDFAMQCDFTSAAVEKLELKVTELEEKVARLKKENANLLESNKKLIAKSEERGEELKKTLLELRNKNEEIESLKCLTEKWD